MPIIVALTFLTILPLPLRRVATARDRGAAVAWYPAAGYLLGSVLALLDLALRRTALTPLVIAVLLLVALALMTGFLHLDGLLDTCDAVFAYRAPAERLVIARDPRAGAFGVVGVALALLLKGTLLAGPLGGQRAAVLVCFPAIARLTMAAAVVLLPTARGTEGLGGSVKEHARPWTLLVASVLAIAPALVLLHGAAVVLIAGALGGGISIAVLALLRLGGTTGDVYGAVCECAEIGALLAAALLG